MNGRKATVVNKFLEKYFSVYLTNAIASGKTILGKKDIKRLARRMSIREIENGKLLAEMNRRTYGE